MTSPFKWASCIDLTLHFSYKNVENQLSEDTTPHVPTTGFTRSRSFQCFFDCERRLEDVVTDLIVPDENRPLGEQMVLIQSIGFVQVLWSEIHSSS